MPKAFNEVCHRRRNDLSIFGDADYAAALTSLPFDWGVGTSLSEL